MFVSKAFQALGRSLIILGGLTLLFVAYQLWGTGVLTDRYQSDLEEDFSELIDVVEGKNIVGQIKPFHAGETLKWQVEGIVN